MAGKSRGWGWMGVVLLAAALPLTGCGSLLYEGTADAAGVAGGARAGAVTKDAGIGSAIGIGGTAAASAGLRYAERRGHRIEQDSIAAVAGALPTGGVAPWQVSRSVPLEGGHHGEVAVSRDIGGNDFACKEIVFSVEDGDAAKPRKAFYTGFVCRDGAVWHWATAEPATARWGSLQ